MAMKILWLCNVILPQVAKVINKPISNQGGWLFSMAESLRNNLNVDFHFCFSVSKGEQYEGEADGIFYHSFTKNRHIDKSSKQNIEEFNHILRKVSPDIIHIFGTEFVHTLDMVNAASNCGLSNNVVISIQGLVSIIARHYCAYLPNKIIKRSSFRDIIKNENIQQLAEKFNKRGRNEVMALRKVCHVIGRTDWDMACTLQINPKLNYYSCNETLRKEFYYHKWSLDKCERFSIFLSQCKSPLKGMHLLLEAMSEIVKHYPEAHLYTTGQNPLLLKGLDKLKQSAYSKYLGRLIIRYNLEKHVTFLGSLTEQQMCQQYLKSHVFISSSSIENSSNSLGEAMILGVPSISSDVGGVKNMLTHNLEGFIYPADEPYMIAYYVDKIFKDDNLALNLSHSAREHAYITHNPDTNIKTLLSIYRDIVED